MYAYICISMKTDIQTESDIALWQKAFYEALLNDPITVPKFAHLNLTEHMPKIEQFWAFILLDKAGYTTNVFQQHTHLQLEAIQFEHWLQHFIHTTNQMFEGPNANTAIERVKLLASTFMYKLHGEYKDFSQIQ